MFQGFMVGKTMNECVKLDKVIVAIQRVDSALDEKIQKKNIESEGQFLIVFLHSEARFHRWFKRHIDLWGKWNVLLIPKQIEQFTQMPKRAVKDTGMATMPALKLNFGIWPN